MATEQTLEQPSEQLHEQHLLTVVKEEPPDGLETRSASSSFCFETVTKEEVILEDPPESVSRPATDITKEEHPFHCSECNRSFANVWNLNRCVKRHNALRLGLYKCKVCGKCSSDRHTHVRHLAVHRKGSNAEDVSDSEPAGEVKSEESGVSVDENGLFKCVECVRTYKQRNMAVKCTKRHLARRLGLFKCKFCDLRAGTLSDLRRHEARHKPNTELLQAVEPAIPEPKKDLPEEDQVEHASEKSTEIFKCTECSKTYNTRNNLNRCMKRHIAIKQELYKCEVCEKVSSSKEVHTRHVNTHKQETNQHTQLENGLFKCAECDRTFKSKYSVNKCMRKHVARRLKLYQCKTCNRVSGTLHDLKEHELNHKKRAELHLQSVKAAIQEKDKPLPVAAVKEKSPKEMDGSSEAVTKKTLSRHLTEVTKERPFQCSECCKTFKQSALALRCERGHNNIKLGRYKCETCGKCCCSKYVLKKHEEIHKKEDYKSDEDDSLFKCSECPRRFREQFLAKRCARRHSAKRLGLYECKICKLRLGNSTELRTHELVHKRTEQDKTFACDVCDARFAYRASITKHKRRYHTGELRFTCHKCNVKFPTRAELLTHITRHDWDETKHKYSAKLVKADDGNYLCTICNKKFINRAPANAHVFRHMNLIEGLFVCKTCGLRSGDAYEHKIHSQIHKKPEEATDASDGKPPPEGTDENPSKEGDIVGKSTALDCKTCRKRLRNKQSLERHEITHRIRKKNSTDFAAAQAAKKSNKTEETGSSFCYETVTKEELIIEDDALDGSRQDDEQEEDSRNSLEGSQVKKDEARRGQEKDSRESELEPSKLIEGATQQNENEVSKNDNLEQHLQGDSSSRMECDICQKGFMTKRNFETHQTLHEKRQTPLECPRCQEEFYDKYSLTMHYEAHEDVVKSKHDDLLVEDEDGYRCLLCDKTFRDREKIIGHVQRHMNVIEGVYHCKVCGLRCGGNGDYQLHIKIHKDNAADQRALPREIEGVHTDYDPPSGKGEACVKSDLPLHCKTCNRFFNSKTNLNVHLWKSKLRIIRPNFKPGESVSKFPTQRTQHSTVSPNPSKPQKRRKPRSRLLKRDDSQIFTDENGFYNCTKCDYKTVKPNMFRGHVRGHKAVEVGLYTCEVCQMRFPNKDHLFYHKKTHLKERFECLTCHEKFATKKDLFKHRLIHTKNVITKQFMEKVTEDEKGVFTCSICGNTHTERKYAISHFRKHVTEKFMCQICEKRCGSRRDLVQHIESQHEKLRFRCSTCKERFETRTALLEHKQMHKSDSKKIRRIDDRYHCTRCDKTYSRRENALNHFKSHGSKEEDAAQSTDSQSDGESNLDQKVQKNDEAEGD
uniref:Zinc finger protein Xfin n=1 Tax=Culex pipiens TaxID=7175 RepID=A0A8D8KNR3_CULPI